jgi:hypothetical protein
MFRRVRRAAGVVTIAAGLVSCVSGSAIAGDGGYGEAIDAIDRPIEWTTEIGIRDDRFPVLDSAEVPLDFRQDSKGEIVLRDEEAAIAALTDSSSNAPIIVIRWISWQSFDEPRRSRLAVRRWKQVDGALFSAEGESPSRLDKVLAAVSPTGDADAASFEFVRTLPSGWAVAEPPRPVRPAARPLIRGLWKEVGAVTADVMDLGPLATAYGPWSIVMEGATPTPRTVDGVDGYFAEKDGYICWIVPMGDEASLQIGAVGMLDEEMVRAGSLVGFVDKTTWEQRYGLFGYDPVGRYALNEDD